ncbi:glycosyltransferase 87 family protein [Streptomyces zhihengii]|uniref:glycosyltransferase 87 family protein n=1 Tax=Streptomyces zhihengii TaxID=1818004 RepID=UPI0036A79632
MTPPETGRRAVRWPVTTHGRLALVTALAGTVLLFLATVPLHRGWFDLGVYHGAVRHWTDGGALYDYLVPGSRYGFTYPPFAALCMLPLAVTAWPAAVAIILLLNAAAAVLIVRWTAGPVIRARGWTPWYALAVAVCGYALLEPVRDTVSFGQVNLLLLALVLADTRLLARGGTAARWAGAGIGVAAAIKLTPAVFIGWLLLTGRRRAAGNAVAVALGATALAAWAAPGASRTFWTDALWHTDRVGSLAYVSNQSWQGVVARLAEPYEPDRAVWALGVVVLLTVWAVRVRRAHAAGDHAASLALTGVLACLVSPVTWVHHLVWLTPALAVLAGAALRTPGGAGRRGPAVWAVAVPVLLSSSLVWLWSGDASGADGFLGGNLYVWISLGLLCALPLRPSGRPVGGARDAAGAGPPSARPRLPAR